MVSILDFFVRPVGDGTGCMADFNSAYPKAENVKVSHTNFISTVVIQFMTCDTYKGR